MNDGGLLAQVGKAWHRTFGEVKCHLSACPVCSDKDWPTASWVEYKRETR